MMTPIRKVVITKFGDVDVVKVLDSTCPPPSTSQVQIATEYSGFIGRDVSMRIGIYPGQIPAPLTPGYCLVGTVRALGVKCTLFQPRFLIGWTINRLPHCCVTGAQRMP
jgi:NADPH:quinone reductase-like Zn-dependent oxidoreductase